MRTARPRGALVLGFVCAVFQSGCDDSRRSTEDRSDSGATRDAGFDAGRSEPDSAVAAPIADAGQTPPETPPAPPPIIADPHDDAAYIYDQSALRTYELLLDPADLAKIDADPVAEEYVAGVLRFEGHDYGPVGIRYKGSVGAFRGCLTGTNAGAKTCTKLSMKVSFNWSDPEGRFYGLKKLQFHAMNRDPSMLKERLGYTLFRESTIAAPRAVHARLLINGELVGLFALVEQIDGRFTRSRFSEGGEGNLYKEGWPLDASGKATTDAVLRPTLQTNEDENPSLQTMLDFGSALEHSDAEGLPEVISTYTNIDYSMRYVAVDRAIANDDGPFHWYCFGIACANHNYYWYEERDSARAWIVTWDLDSSFNLNNTTTTLWFDWDDSSLGCRAMADTRYPVPLRSPTCDKLLRGWAELQDRYLAETKAFLDGPFDGLRVESELATWEAQIAPAVEEASSLHEDALTPEQWHDATAALRDAITELRSRAQDRVARGPIEIGDPWLVQPPMDAGMSTVGEPATEHTVDDAGAAADFDAGG